MGILKKEEEKWLQNGIDTIMIVSNIRWINWCLTGPDYDEAFETRFAPRPPRLSVRRPEPWTCAGTSGRNNPFEDSNH